MQAGAIRPIVLCLFRHENHILVSSHYDTVKQEWFCRPVGGGIEFGEQSRSAMRREIQEELGVPIDHLALLGVLESLFTYEGRPGHEIVFVYDATFVDRALYQQTTVHGWEQGITMAFTATWKSVEELRQGAVRLVPDGLLDLLHKLAPPQESPS